MAVVAKFTCPDDGHEFGVLWTIDTPVICPKCGKKWAAALCLDENQVGFVRITGPAPIEP